MYEFSGLNNYVKYMKNLFTLLFILGAVAANAQLSGVIQFEESRKFEINFDGGPEMEAIRSQLPTSRSSKYNLTFNAEASIYRPFEEDEEEAPSEVTHTSSSGGNVVMVKMDFVQPDNKLYRDIAAGAVTEQREFMGKLFLIDGEADLAWKMTGEVKEILGYNCQQALAGEGEEQIIAWFAPQLAVSAGPATFGKLPGMILEVESEEGKRTITAVNVELKDVDAADIKAPKKGKQVSNEEFEAIMAEKMKEMNEMKGGNGVFIMKERHN